MGDGEHMVIEEMASEVKVPSDDEGSQGTVTPKARLYLTSLPPVVRSRNSITDSKAQEASSDGCMLEGSPVTRSKRRLDLESKCLCLLVMVGSRNHFQVHKHPKNDE